MKIEDTFIDDVFDNEEWDNLDDDEKEEILEDDAKYDYFCVDSLKIGG